MTDSWLGTIQITGLDMLIVFLVLWLLAVVIKGTRAGTRLLEKRSSQGRDDLDEQLTEVSDVESESEEGPFTEPVAIPTVKGPDFGGADDNQGSELVAVITAAVTIYMGEEAVPFAIKSITPVDGITTESWLLAGRQRLMDLRSAPARRR